MRRDLLAGVLLSSMACSHAPPPSAETKVERRDDWLLALKSDLERIASNDGFQGQFRVLHGGKPEIDNAVGDTTCLALGAGRRLLAAVAVASWSTTGSSAGTTASSAGSRPPPGPRSPASPSPIC